MYIVYDGIPHILVYDNLNTHKLAVNFSIMKFITYLPKAQICPTNHNPIITDIMIITCLHYTHIYAEWNYNSDIHKYSTSLYPMMIIMVYTCRWSHTMYMSSVMYCLSKQHIHMSIGTVMYTFKPVFRDILE